MIEAEFITSAVALTGMPSDGRPEIALLGRSNVGKSSLINGVLQRKALARTSQNPGRTRVFNFYLVDNAFYLVDLPGYGYAKVSMSERQKWWQLMRNYLWERKTLYGVMQLLDIRHEPSKEDRQWFQEVDKRERPYLAVATKADKVGANVRQERLLALQESLSLPDEPIAVSNVLRFGYDEVLQAMRQLVATVPES